MPRPERSVEYVAFMEIVHGRWARLELTTPSPEAAVKEIRAMKFTGRISLVRQKSINEYEQEGSA